ncbi:hypothetical protein PL8927_270009 [Planktothrix serta PCC 8927]|uniref:Uncharacterized protein n=1 Tax=Planktothrix serta PCC 8927 TaxID=671068 RepID=A0A7Z9BH61_9CYAN|nr:hypothetical protein PL8927_270009 [Planktothrix serta PCC 8927]
MKTSTLREWLRIESCPNQYLMWDGENLLTLLITIRILNQGGGNPVFADGGCVRPLTFQVRASVCEFGSLHQPD